MKVKLIITDIDHTAVHSPSVTTATKRLKEAIASAEKAGIMVSAATGRACSWAKCATDSMNLRRPFIVGNGAQIIHPSSGKAIWEGVIGQPSLNKVIMHLKEKRYSALWNDYNEEDYISGGWDISNLSVSENVVLIDILFIPNDEVKELYANLSGIPGITLTSARSWQEGKTDILVTAGNASKQHTTERLMNMLGVLRSETIGVGDSANDIPLFKAVGYRVAVSNATDAIKETADEIIGDVKNDALADYIHELIKEES